MTQTTHTPGPWIAEFSDYGEEIWFGGYGAGMWTVEPPGAYLDGLSAANARLIAAAPDLLAALEQCLPIIDAYRRAALGDGDIAAHNARVAIAKAKGE